MVLKDFSDRLNQLHNQSGQSQQAAVEMIRRKTKEDIHQTSFGNWLRADREPLLSAAIALATAYNVSVEWLAGIVEDKRPVTVILERLRQLTFTEDVETAARLLMQMPPEQRRVHIAAIQADHEERKRNEERWRLLVQSVQAGTIDESMFNLAPPVRIDKPSAQAVPQTLFDLAR